MFPTVATLQGAQISRILLNSSSKMIFWLLRLIESYSQLVFYLCYNLILPSWESIDSQLITFEYSLVLSIYVCQCTSCRNVESFVKCNCILGSFTTYVLRFTWFEVRFRTWGLEYSKSKLSFKLSTVELFKIDPSSVPWIIMVFSILKVMRGCLGILNSQDKSAK